MFAFFLLLLMFVVCFQVQLYQYMASDFLANANFPQILRRVPTVIEMMHSLKHYYYVIEPKTPSQYTVRLH